jgi:hypothetical protein
MGANLTSENRKCTAGAQNRQRPVRQQRIMAWRMYQPMQDPSVTGFQSKKNGHL